MSSDTGTNTGAPLDLDYLDASQAQPEVKVNDAWDKINTWASEHAGGGSQSSDTGGGSVTVTDGTTIVDNVRTILFTGGGAVVTAATDSTAEVAVSPGGGGGSESSGGTTTHFGSGAPSTLFNLGDLYFDTTSSPMGAYVCAPADAPTADVIGTPVTHTFSGTDTGNFTIDVPGSSGEAMLCVAFHSEESGSAATLPLVSVTGTNGLTYSRLTGITGLADTVYQNLELWGAPLAVGESYAETITVTTTGNIDDASMVAFAIDNLGDSSSPMDPGTGLPFTALCPATGSEFALSPWGTSADNDLLVYIAGTSNNNVITAPTDFTLLANANNGGGGNYSYSGVATYAPGEVLPSPQSLTTQFTPGAGGNAAAILVAFQSAATGKRWRLFN
jgi:hypothetical protein